MTIYSSLVAAFWLIFIVYWAYMAVGAKQNIDSRFWWRDIGWRVGVIVLIVLALRLPIFHHALRSLRAYAASPGIPRGVLGVGLCALGIGVAIWARFYLGRNWGMPMSRKADPELVTSGPYAYVRHPIYTGMLLAMLGSAICESALWWVPLVLFGLYFLYSAQREEKLMREQFPRQYPAYMERTKMLIPFLF